MGSKWEKRKESEEWVDKYVDNQIWMLNSLNKTLKELKLCLAWQYWKWFAIDWSVF